MRVVCRLAGSLLGLVLFASVTHAQPVDNYWGLQGSFVPKWEVQDVLKPLFDAESLAITGGEFRIGFARGRTLGGEWGLVYVKKTVEDGSLFVTEDGIERRATGVSVDGVSLDGYAPFVTIKERVQIGLAYGFGAGWAKGTVTERDTQNNATATLEGKDFFTPFGVEIPVVPLVKLELGASVIVAPGLKVRVSAGANYPGSSKLTISGVFFFGER